CDEAGLRLAIFDGLWWDPATPLRTSVSDATLSAPIELQEAVAEGRSNVQVWTHYPHLVLHEGPFLFTSVHVAMVKSASPSADWKTFAPRFPARPSVKERLVRIRKRIRA